MSLFIGKDSSNTPLVHMAYGIKTAEELLAGPNAQDTLFHTSVPYLGIIDAIETEHMIVSGEVIVNYSAYYEHRIELVPSLSTEASNKLEQYIQEGHLIIPVYPLLQERTVGTPGFSARRYPILFSGNSAGTNVWAASCNSFQGSGIPGGTRMWPKTDFRFKYNTDKPECIISPPAYDFSLTSSYGGTVGSEYNITSTTPLNMNINMGAIYTPAVGNLNSPFPIATSRVKMYIRDDTTTRYTYNGQIIYWNPTDDPNVNSYLTDGCRRGVRVVYYVYSLKVDSVTSNIVNSLDRIYDTSSDIRIDKNNIYLGNTSLLGGVNLAGDYSKIGISLCGLASMKNTSKIYSVDYFLDKWINKEYDEYFKPQMQICYDSSLPIDDRAIGLYSDMPNIDSDENRSIEFTDTSIKYTIGSKEYTLADNTTGSRLANTGVPPVSLVAPAMHFQLQDIRPVGSPDTWVETTTVASIPNITGGLSSVINAIYISTLHSTSDPIILQSISGYTSKVTVSIEPRYNSVQTSGFTGLYSDGTGEVGVGTLASIYLTDGQDCQVGNRENNAVGSTKASTMTISYSLWYVPSTDTMELRRVIRVDNSYIEEHYSDASGSWSSVVYPMPWDGSWYTIPEMKVSIYNIGKFFV